MDIKVNNGCYDKSEDAKSDIQAENFYFQVKFINCYLREIISFTK